jgi:PIN domain nuclease of toxin-antitoxin system
VTGLLLDTHVFLWYSSYDSKLPEDVRDRIRAEPGPVFLSNASAWEIAIKHGLGKLELPQPIEDLLDVEAHGIEFLDLSAEDHVAYSRLSFPLKDHRDPFDRILVIQAIENDLVLVTADPVFKAYLPTNLLFVR